MQSHVLIISSCFQSSNAFLYIAQCLDTHVSAIFRPNRPIPQACRVRISLSSVAFQVNFDAALPQVQGERLAPSEEQRFTGHVTLDENASASSMADFDILDKLGCGVHGQVSQLQCNKSILLHTV
eukprot:TRINITY_DN12453_c0_g9_i2.p5 TRINITY_DN12453_c0_g9~~TRINITY_DN12453_c0_g9_i2.p5  ORF type:complete len:125 (+),score=8.18 TRINITY_DN12453_c0_g9_i2:159-533(+)